jgi:hypothetical protein
MMSVVLFLVVVFVLVLGHLPEIEVSEHGYAFRGLDIFVKDKLAMIERYQG